MKLAITQRRSAIGRAKDQKATIEFLKPGRGCVRAHMCITDADLDAMRAAAANRSRSTLKLWGLNIQLPFSQLILTGVKTTEVRGYALGRTLPSQCAAG